MTGVIRSDHSEVGQTNSENDRNVKTKQPPQPPPHHTTPPATYGKSTQVVTTNIEYIPQSIYQSLSIYGNKRYPGNGGKHQTT